MSFRLHALFADVSDDPCVLDMPSFDEAVRIASIMADADLIFDGDVCVVTCGQFSIDRVSEDGRPLKLFD